MFAFTYNKPPKQVKGLTCTLSGPTASSGGCDAVVASGSGSQSGKSYSGLANGSYTFSVSDASGPASATRHFTINVSAPARHIYWSNASIGIGRADIDGQNPNAAFISGVKAPGLAVDSGHIYWVTGGRSRCHRSR